MKKIANDQAITFELDVPFEEVAYLLSHAFSGDVGYWCRLGKLHKKGLTKARRAKLGDITNNTSEPCWLPLVFGCGVEVIEHNDSNDPKDWSKPVLLDKVTLVRGFKLMSALNPYQFGCFLSDNADMTTGDVFLQFCVLGEEKYG